MGASLLDRIAPDPEACHGQPTVWRLPLLDLKGWMTHEDVLANYPDLEEEDLRAVMSYAAVVVRTAAKVPRAA